MKLLFLPMSQLIKTYSSAWVNQHWTTKTQIWNYDLLIASGGFGAYSAYAAHHASNLSPWRAYEGTFQGFQHHSSYGKKPVHLSIAHSIPSHSVPFIPSAWFRPRPAVTGAPSAHHKTPFSPRKRNMSLFFVKRQTFCNIRISSYKLLSKDRLV